MGKHKKNRAAATKNKDKNKKKPVHKAKTIKYDCIVSSMTIARPSSMDKKEYQRFISAKVKALFNAIHEDNHANVVTVFRETSQNQRSLLANALIHRGKEGYADQSKVSLLFETIIPMLKNPEGPNKGPSAEIVKTLLENGASTVDDDVFCRMPGERGGASLIGYCAHDIRCHSITSLLLRHGADPNGFCPGGASPLFYAIHYNSPQLVRDLVERGADTINVVEKPTTRSDPVRQDRAILIALTEEEQQKNFSVIPIFRILKETNALHLDLFDTSYRTIYMAIKIGHLEILQYALAQQGPDGRLINGRCNIETFRSPSLFMGCCFGDPEVVRELIRAGFPTRGLRGISQTGEELTILQSIFFFKVTYPLMAKNRMELVKVFAEEGCLHIEETTIDQCNVGALLLAVQSGNVEMVSFLIKAAKGNERFLTQEDEQGRNAAFHAVAMSDPQMVMEIMKCDCAFEMFVIENDHFMTPLMHACAKKASLEILEQLLEFGIPVDRRNSIKIPPLHVAVATDNLNAVKVLLRRGSKEARSALGVALVQGNKNRDENLDITYELFRHWIKNDTSEFLDSFYELFKCFVVHHSKEHYVLERFPSS